jgi:D-alanyl-D-alanine carboxypeptidase
MLFAGKSARWLRRVAASAVLFLCCQGAHARLSPAPNTLDYVQQNVKARCALLVDVQSGSVLYARRSAEPSPPASTIKLLTALTAYEAKGMEGRLKITREDTYAQPSHIPLVAGEEVAVRDLFYALLIESANDAALALARHAGGTVENFIRMMNAKAARLGCRNSRFKNPNGLPVSGQYTTAEDMLKIFEAAIAVPEIRSICKTKYYVLKTAAKKQRLKNHNRLLGVYPYMGPAKTGWTYASRHTYAAAAQKNGRELHLVLLNSPNKWKDAPILFDYGFALLDARAAAPLPANASSAY